MTPKVFALLRAATVGKKPADFVLTRKKKKNGVEIEQPVREYRMNCTSGLVSESSSCANCGQPVTRGVKTI